MATKQVYDKEGTTNFQFTFVDKTPLKKRNYKEWHVFFTQGFISINDHSGQTHLKVNYPEEDHWVYEERDVTCNSGSFCRGAEIKTKDFTLIVDVREYLEPDDPDFDPEYNEEGSPEGYLELNTKISHITISIPYKLALNLMKFMAGSTTKLDGICGVIKSK